MRLVPIAVLAALFLVPSLMFAAPITLVHQWQSPSELKALNVLETDLAKKSLELNTAQPKPNDLKDAAGIKALASTFTENPVFLALTNETLRHWYDLRLVHSLSPLAEAQGWADIFPPTVLKTVTHRDQIIAAPMSVHISNGVWANKQLIDATGLTLDTNWGNFVAILSALQAAGVIPIAHDGSETHDILLFETLYLSLFGAPDYTLLFDELNPTVLRRAEPNFEAVFERLATLKPFINRLPEGSLWHETAQQLMDGQAGIVIQGDWIHGEFARKGRIANQHYYCTEFPGPFQTVSLRVDAMASLNTTSLPLAQDQTTFFSTVTNKDVQFLFNNYKGGLPAHADTGLEAVSECLRVAVQRMESAIERDTLVLSLSQGMAVRDVIKNEIGAVIHEFMTTDMSPVDAANQLQKRMKYASYLIN